MAFGGSFGCPPLALRPSVIAAARGMPPSLPMRPGISGPFSFEFPLPICAEQSQEIDIGQIKLLANTESAEQLKQERQGVT